MDQYGRTIHTADDNPRIGQGRYRRWVQRLVKKRYPQARLNWQVRGSINAEVARGEWRVDCPHCTNAQIIAPGEPFICVDCLNVGNGGYAYSVAWPADRQAIERVLLARTNRDEMNYLPTRGDTLATLRAENLAHGVPGQIGA